MVAPSFSWSAGSATFTAVPSIDAMLEPRIVAASTHLPAFFLSAADTSAAPAAGVITGGFPIRAIKP